MGRHKGSLNKKTIEKITQQEVDTTIKILEKENILPIKRGRGRPRKNNNIIQQPVEKTEITGNKRDINLEIKQLKRLKLQCKAGSQERIDLHRKIKELKTKVNDIQESFTPEKQDLLNKILERKPPYIKALNIDYTKFTLEQLAFHYKKITEEGYRE